MNSKNVQFGVGIFVLVGIAAILYLAIKIGGGQLIGGEVREVEARFQNVGGLNSGSNVMMAGMKVGTIGSMTLDPERIVVNVQLLLDKKKIEGVTVYDDAIASIKTNGLIGDKFIALDPGGSGIELEDGEPIIDTESALDIESLISRFAFGDIGGKPGEKKEDSSDE